MVSTFGSLATAYSGLAAARAGIDVTGQNIANAGTAGYTRQRVTQNSVPATQTGFMRGTAALAGQGVSVDGIARLASLTLDVGVRVAAGSSAYADARATALSALETGLHEPGKDGLSAKLDAFWSSWSELASHPDDPGAASAVIGAAGTVASALAAGSKAVDAQWSSVRGTAAGQVTQLNDAAKQVADLNGRIRTALASGGNANELLDQRDQLTEQIATLAGGTTRTNADGTVDVLLGGNPLVQGTDARAVALGGGERLADGAAVTLTWTSGSAGAVSLSGGSIGGALAVLAPANGNGTGGALAQAAASYDAVATQLAETVNAVHATGTTPAGTTGTAFFALAAGVPAAQGLSVVPTDGSGLATRNAAGQLDDSFADALSRLGTGPGAADTTWATFVAGVGTASRSAATESTLTGLALTNARTQQQSSAGVDLDEENVNLLSYQHAYQGAARVLTAVDEMLDTIINRVGLVGRG
ncbi:flagellar hook-associated protein 1 FlgK [Curtobacterium sp. PhB172]|uniref:flagellar hook-associated protein FlgK n=1 Tax=unclassified Curtobacterium TaxID=257496 RepID=UPI000F494619|nr:MULTISPECIES: flagellar hook-associated protein FlgK [unclassified Curtobacterium]ROQ06117.1 flagellar hook-associated protein 1 FlgK [Curtobacterium sp. PhB171]ROQ22736.1 flagellar hook-associated protein 1 FlgK [Curtobacterium sp. PhB170]ROS34312.1 flagellar hook-associated protein 1 FlgK [Curtobacterium sp. PhB131]ROS67403.1 flagellar hook-associated protein 1 FlgK [Curtobacterium sp. PhB172]ROS74252.1 flagellar hook-associated protein 1 FlgK [Curtobacterium sp. PhB141]